MSALPPNPSRTAQFYPGGTMPGQAPPVPPWFIAGAPAQPRLDRARLKPTILVAAIIAAVVLGGMGLDNSLAAPSAGRVNIGGPVYLTARPGWVTTADGGASGSGVKLQKGNVIFVAQASPGYSGNASAVLAEARTMLDDGSAQISFSAVEHPTFGGHPAAAVSFAAIVSSQERGSMTIEGVLICMVIDGNAVVIEAFAPQGAISLDIDDIKAMADSVEVTQ